jgi:glyoxylase-like metal-dependent hydrolase (beta-lactamase superfamily II)
MGQRVQTKFIAWYVTDGTRKVLVDSGLPDEAFARQWHPYNNPRVATDQRMANALAAHGTCPEDIDLVIWTHLHWDHSGKPGLFTKAEFVVSREEVRYAIAPCPIHYVAYEAVQIGLEPAFLKMMARTRLVDMVEQEIFPGLRLIPTPGHSVGSMSLVVGTTAGPYVITGDAVSCYENLAGDPARKLPYVPTGIFVDLVAMWDSMARIDAAAGFQKDHILPGHEAQVFKHVCYPPAPPTGGSQ